MGKSGESKRRLLWPRKKKKEEEGEVETDLLNKTENGHVTGDPAETLGEFVPQDGGWGWVVCLTSLWANGTVFGIINTFGIIYVAMTEHFSATDSDVSLKTAFVGSTCTGVTFLMCTVSSIMSDRVGIRTTAVTGAILATAGLLATAFINRLELLYLTFGIMLGIGSSMVYSPSLVILGHYFRKHMGLVNGIVSFGSSVFTLGLTRILPYLLENIGIKYCFLFLAGLQFMLILFTLTWKPVFKKEDHLAALTLSTESVYQHCNDCCSWTRQFLNVKIWKKKAYVIWVVSLGIALFGYFVPFFHLPKHIKDNFPGEDGSLPILCLSITSGVSRIICGKVADLPWVSRIKMQQLAFVLLGISTVCIPFSKSFGGIIAISLVMGVCDGIFVCLIGPIAFDIVGPAEASQAIGFLLGIFSVPFTIGPPVAGWMYDTMGDYRIAFHVAGIPPILGSIVMFFIPKVEQSYPAVTETMEFASISMLDVYNEVRVPKKNLPRSRLAEPSGPSGPSTELEYIRSNEILNLGIVDKPPVSNGNQSGTPTQNGDLKTGNQSEIDGNQQETETENQSEINGNQQDKEIENQSKRPSHNDEGDEREGGEESMGSERTPMLTDNSEIDKQIKQDDNDPVKQSNVTANANPESHVEVSKDTKDTDAGGMANTDSDDKDNNDGDGNLGEPYVMDSSSLLDEVGKYFEANRVSFADEKSTI